ncbi:MAG TPA: hypothetical protein EYP80_01120, partial [Candidatus Aenigmarchaeota archaeon]|nr:hypothetical protein [Candidatus Aenigmarchaeota archaeon]
RRIIYLLLYQKVEPKEIVVFTFTEKAAQSMKSRIYDINLPNNSEVDCLIVTFYDKSNGTRGFCYTSPPGGELLKDIGWTALSIVADIGVQGLLSITGVGASAAGVIGCEVGNAIMWFGQNQISEEKEKRLWPKNLFFGNYFGD